MNIVIMSFIWMSTSFNFYLINFQLKYFPGNIYVNSVVFSTCSIVAYVVSNPLYKFMGLKISFILSFLISSIGGFLIVLWGLNTDVAWVFPCLVLLASFGTANMFNLLYCTHSHIFPTAFAAGAMGICNFTARIMTIFSPMVAEIEGSIPMWTFTVLSVVSLVLTLFIQVDKH